MEVAPFFLQRHSPVFRKKIPGHAAKCNGGVSQRFGISGIPTLILFRNGQEVHRISGAMPLKALKAEFERFLDKTEPVQ
jgi:hypothetical protein